MKLGAIRTAGFGLATIVLLSVPAIAFLGAGLSAYALALQKKPPDQPTVSPNTSQPAKPTDKSGPGNKPAPSSSGEKIPPLVKGGAPIGTEFQYDFAKDDSLLCVNEYVKVSPTKWQERPVRGGPAGCLVGAVIFKYTERESDDPHYILLYDEGRNLLARFSNTQKGQMSPSEWRLVSSQGWNVSHSVMRTN
jgi:hypothetical protein